MHDALFRERETRVEQGFVAQCQVFGGLHVTGLVRELFPEPTTPRLGPLAAGEPVVHWYTESTRSEAVSSRAVVNSWYEAFPDVDRRLARRILSDQGHEHLQAIDELYVHHLLRQQYDDVRYEEASGAPDFRIYAQGKRVVGVEVVSLFDRADWQREEARHDRIAEELNRRVRPTAGYFVDFEVELGASEPAPTRFAEYIRAQIASLPPHETVHSPISASTPYEDAGVRISVRFLPMRANAASKTDPGARIVAMGAMIGGFVNSGQRVKERVESKAGGRYDVAGNPYIVAVGVHDPMWSHDQAVTGLYGNEAVVVATLQAIRRNDGVFGLDRDRPQGRQRRLSGVLVISNLHTWSTPPATLTLYENPYAESSIPDDLVPGARRFGAVLAGDGRRVLTWR